MLGHNGRYVYHSNGQGPEDADFIPARPPFHYSAKDLFIEIYFDDHSAAWSFGDGGDLGPDLSMIARDQHGNIVETDAEELFPEVDGTLVPEHDELIRYVDVANAELLLV